MENEDVKVAQHIMYPEFVVLIGRMNGAGLPRACACLQLAIRYLFGLSTMPAELSYRTIYV